MVVIVVVVIVVVVIVVVVVVVYFCFGFVHQCQQVAATCSIQITYKYHAILLMFASLHVTGVYCFWLTNVDDVLNVKKCNRSLEPKHEHS